MPQQNGYLGFSADNNGCDNKQNSKTMGNLKQQRVKTVKSEKSWLKPNTDFLIQHKDQLKLSKLRMKRLQDDLQRMEKSVLQKDAFIKDLQEKIQENIKKCPQSSIKNKNLENECNHYQQLYHQENLKYSTLESSYDKKVFDLRNEFERISKQQCDQQQILVEQIKQITKDFQTLHDEHKLKQQKLNQIENELNTVKSKNEIELKNVKEENATLIKEYEFKISNMQTELKQKDDIIYKCTLENNQLEIAKNKIINEQAYKLHQVNRVIDQPTIIVQPTSSKLVNSNEIDEKDNRTTLSQTSEVKQRFTKEQMRQSANSKQIHKTENNTSHTNVRLRKPERKVNYFEYDSTSDEEQSVEGWHPVLSKEKSEKAQPSFHVQKRQIEDTEIPSSSDIDKRFNCLLGKRIKN